jgi:hypothetical protein
MLRGIRDRDGCLLGEGLDRARALAEEIEQIEPLRGREGLPEPRELLIVKDRTLAAVAPNFAPNFSLAPC